MKNLWKKLAELAVASLVPVIIEMVVEQLDAWKKKIQNQNEAA